jgi:hypothetical protein
MLDPKVVAKGFGGGDHATGVRNLNDIVRRAGGYEPGPTVAKKGKKGFAQSGGAGDPRRRRAPPTIPNPAAVFAAHPAVASAPSPYLAETAGKPALPPSNDFLTSGLFGDQTPAPVPQAPIAGNMHGLFNKLMPPPAAPSTGALTAPLPPQPTLKNMAQTAVAENASALPKVPLITESGNGFQIRDAIQAGGRPGSQISFNYGAGHGMEAGAAPIVATADKTGKFNQFGNMGLRAARGGVVPGFQESGVVKPGFFPVPAGPLQDVTDLGARAQLAQDRWDKRWTAGLEAKAAADAEAAAAAKAAEAEAVRSGKSFTEGMRNTYQQPIGAAAKAGAQRAYEIGKAVLPEAATIGKVARGVSRTMPYVGAGMAGVDLVDVASDPNKTKGDVVNEAAGQAGRLGAAGVGAYGGAMLGAMTGPGAVVASPVLAALGGIGGYMGAGKLIHAGREFFGADPRDPSETSQGWFKKKGETPTAADVPQAAAVAEKPAAPAAPEKPSLRDIMMLRAMALGGGGTGAMKEQGHLLGYLGQTEGLGNSAAATMAKLQSENEKDIDASIKGLLQKSVTDPKTGKTEKVDDLAAEQRMRADLTAHRGPDGQPIDIYKMDRRQRDAVINEWVERDRAQQKLKARQVESGDKKQLVSDRTRPITLKQGGMGLGDWWGSPNIKFWDDYVPSFYGGGLRNKVAQVPVLDPTTGKPTIQSFPATVPFTNEQGFPDLEALSHARNAGK